MTTTATVTEYTIDRDEMLTIRRSGEGDAWAVRLRSSRLHRDALAWRAANPGAPIVAPTTCGAWDYEPMPTNRDDEWIASHTFALAEALAVCEAEAGATAERERDEARAAWGLHATRPEAVAEVLADLEREHAEVTRRLDLARVAVRSVARPVRR